MNFTRVKIFEIFLAKHIFWTTDWKTIKKQSTFLEQNQYGSFNHSLQEHQVVNLVKLFGAGEKTSDVLKNLPWHTQ